MITGLLAKIFCDWMQTGVCDFLITGSTSGKIRVHHATGAAVRSVSWHARLQKARLDTAPLPAVGSPADPDHGRCAVMMVDDVPPQNLEAETGVLGSILLDGRDVFDDVAMIVRPEDFYRSSHELIFRSIATLAGNQSPVDLYTVSEQLRREGKFDTIGGHDALVELTESVPHTLHARYYADIVRQKATLRETNCAALDIIADVRSHQFTGAEMLERAEARIFAVGNHRQTIDIATARIAVEDSENRLRERGRWNDSGDVDRLR